MIHTGLIMMIMMTVANCQTRTEMEKLTGLVPYENGTVSCKFYVYFRLPDYVDRKRSRIYCYPGPKSGTIIKDYNIKSSTGEFYFTLSFKFSSGSRSRILEGSIHKNEKPTDKVMAKNETVCSNPESKCLPDDASKPKGYLATEPCGDGSTCYLRNYEVSFGPFGNLGDPNDYPFSDKQLSANNGDIEKIDIFVGDFSGNAKIITGIQVTYGGVEGPLHGGGGTGEFYTIHCESNVANGQFFGGTFGRARTNGGFDSFVYQLGFTQTSNNKQLCVAGTDNNNAEAFNIQAPISSTFTLAFVSGTASLASGAGGMLGGLTFHFKSKA